MPAGSSVIWKRPAGLISLGYREIHVWRSFLDQESGRIVQIYDLLSPDEQERAERFRVAQSRNSLIVARALLRSILSFYVGAEPAKIKFQYGQSFPLQQSFPLPSGS